MHEYKAVSAPTRGSKGRGLKTTGDRFAQAVSEALNVHAAEGWEFLRTETLPCEERGWFSGVRLTNQIMLIFRRPLALPESAAMPPAVAEERGVAAPIPLHARPERSRSEPVFRPGALLRHEGARATPPLRGDTQPVDAGETGGTDGGR